ncbi:MAG: DUF4956 domain-containing protein [Bacteroidota bacterium]
MGKFEQYLQDFSNTVDFWDFLANIVVAAVLATILRIFYIRFGNSVSNRSRFASNFLPLALTTMLIITIVKSSIALSLGLVGALSIVRFRAAIKDPEELTYLFLVIGIGLATGANQPIAVIVAFTFIVILLYVNNLFNGRRGFKREDKMYINISTDVDDLEKITNILTKTLTYVELKRLDKMADGLDLSFICKADSIKDLNTLKNDLGELSKGTTFSVIDQPDLIA